MLALSILPHLMTRAAEKKAIMKAVMAHAGMQTEARSVLFSLPVSDIAGLRMLETDPS